MLRCRRNSDTPRRGGQPLPNRPNTLLRAGIDKNTLAIGSEIVVRGYQSKDKACAPACKANGRDVTFADGRKLFMGSSGTGAPRDGADPRERAR